MKKTIKWFAVLAAMVMGLSFAGCSDSSDDDDDDDVVVPTVKEAKTSVEVKVLTAENAVTKNENSEITDRVLLSYNDGSSTTYYFSDGSSWKSLGSKPEGKDGLSSATDATAVTILVADGKYYLQNAVYERGATSDIKTIEDTFTCGTKSLTFKAGNKVDYCTDTSDAQNTTIEYSYTNNAGVLVVDSDDPDQNITALYDGKTSIYDVTALEAEEVKF